MFQTQSRTIGDITVDSIIETNAGSVVQQTIPHATPEAIKKIPWLTPYYADEKGRLLGLVQSFLIRTPTATILVDTCVGNHRDRPDVPEWHQMQTNFLDRLAQICPLSAIDVVLCTHLHFDHVGWNTKKVDGQRIPTFPQARYLFAEKEYSYRTSFPSDAIDADANAIRDSVIPLEEAGVIDLVGTNHTIGEGISLVPRHGHTPGHVSVRIESAGSIAFISGDVLHHPCHIPHPGWYTGADIDRKQAEHARRDFVATCKEHNALLIGSHFAAPSAGYIHQANQESASFRPLLSH